MGRRKKDKQHEQVINSIYQASQKPNFFESLRNFQSRWEENKYDNVFEDRQVFWDEELKQKGYQGLYYELRELCDSFLIPWPLGGGVILRIIDALRNGNSIEEALSPVYCPPMEHWQMFRMAKSGLGLPRKSELDKLNESDRKTDYRQIERNLKLGLPQSLVAKLQNKTERNVRSAIKDCREYLDKTGDINNVADLAGLEGDEILILAIWVVNFKTGKIKPENLSS